MNLKKSLTALVVAMAAMPIATQAAEYFQPMAMEGVELMGSVKFGILDYENNDPMERGFYAFNRENFYQPRKDSPLHKCQVAGGAVYHNGLIYSMEYDDDGRIHLEKPWWRIYKAENFELVSERQLSDNCEHTTTTLTYDPTRNKIYGFLKTFTENFFVEIDPETGDTRRVAQLEYNEIKWLGLACTKKGTLYVIYANRASGTPYLGKIRQSDGRVATIGALDIQGLMPDDIYVNGHYSQCMFINNADNRMYWIYPSATNNLQRDEYSAIMEVTPSATPTATLVAYFVDHLDMPGAFFVEPRLTAPAIIDDFKFTTTSDDRLNGTITVKIPTKDYEGNQLSGPLTLTVKEKGETLIETTVQPGDVYVSAERKYSNEEHTVMITVTNSAGEAGPTVKRSFYAGFDIPKACQNIKLTADGLTTTLKWDAPVTGMNGAPIDPSSFTYTVVRYPNEVTVAEGLKECQFVETHPSDMTRYVYVVYAVDAFGRTGQKAMSNNLIVGTPLDPPYGGYFTEAADFFNYYTILDCNHDGTSQGGTWSFDKNTNSAFYAFHPYNDADDWIVSPPINYKSGVKYELSFNAYSANKDYPESMEVYFGNDRTPQALNKYLLGIPVVPAVDEDNPVQKFTAEFTVDKDGVYYYGLHASSPAYSWILYVFNIRVREKPDSAVDAIGTDAATWTVEESAGQICVNNPAGQLIEIYNIAGIKVAQSSATTFTQSLPAGIYVVRSNGKSCKVAVH